MKPFYLVVLITLFSLNAHCQSFYYDVIYPINGIDSITSCQILKIKKGNHIIYKHKNNQDTIEAIAVVRDGRFIDFRTREEIENNAFPILNPITKSTIVLKPEIKDYNYYNKQYLNALGQKKAGLAFTLLGAGCVIIGINILANSSSNNSPNYRLGSILFTGGTLAFHLGLPYLIIGSVKAKNNKKAMLQHQKTDISLNLGMTNNGLGLIINF